jgi:hypothetical protein
MLHRWLTRRRERRRARLDARAESTRVRTFAVVREVAEPLVTLGAIASAPKRVTPRNAS